MEKKKVVAQSSGFVLYRELTDYPREQYTQDPVLSALKDLSKERNTIKLGDR